MEQQAEKTMFVFGHLVSTSVAMKGSFEPIESANPFQQSNAQGKLKNIDSFDEIAKTAKTSGKKLVAAFSN